MEITSFSGLGYSHIGEGQATSLLRVPTKSVRYPVPEVSEADLEARKARVVHEYPLALIAMKQHQQLRKLVTALVASRSSSTLRYEPEQQR